MITLRPVFLPGIFETDNASINYLLTDPVLCMPGNSRSESYDYHYFN